MTVKVLKIKVLLFIILISTSTSFSQDTISHVVKKGETLYSISKLYDVEISELKKQNNLLTNELSINQKIIFVKTNNAYNDVIEEEEKKTKRPGQAILLVNKKCRKQIKNLKKQVRKKFENVSQL